VAAAYSKRLLMASAASGVFSGGPPAGYIWVVKAIDAVADNPIAAPSIIVAAVSPGATWWVGQSSTANDHYESYRGMVVINAGEQLLINAAAGKWEFQVSGYLLHAQ
jgi:hypothetical protein